MAGEAHSSQTGEAASKLKQVLSAEEQKELADGGEVSSEDILIATMTSRADDQGITYVAYKATLSDATDPNIVLNLRSTLDAAGYYDEFEVNRVVEVELNPKSKQSDLQAAVAPVADRLVKRSPLRRSRTGTLRKLRTTKPHRLRKTSWMLCCCSGPT